VVLEAAVLAGAADFPVAEAALAAVAREEAGNFMHPRKFSRHLQHNHLVEAIQQAELKTTGKIQVSISPKRVDDPVAAAQAEFLRLGMNQSPERNGVLIFVSPRSHKFAVIGDEAVHAKCGDKFWRMLADAMTGYFHKSEFTPGIIHGVQKAGDLLAEHFPRHH
jgi:uncharacterized membrane protein